MDNHIHSKTHFTELAVVRTETAQLVSKYEELGSRLEQANDPLEIFAAWNALRDQYATNRRLAEIRYTLDTRDDKRLSDKRFFDEQGPEIDELDTSFIQRILEHKGVRLISDRHGKRLLSLLQMKVRNFDPKVKEHLRRESELCTAYSKLSAGWLFDFEGERLNISKLQGYCLHPDRSKRHLAHMLRAEAYEKHGKDFDQIFDGLVRVRHEKAQILGYDSYTQFRYQEMGRFDYGPDAVALFRNDVLASVLPRIESSLKKQCQALGVDEVMYWDEEILDREGPPKPIGDEAALIQSAATMFSELSGESSQFFSEMLSLGLMDLEARDGKAFGGYCQSLPTPRRPFIFANFKATKDDVIVLAHECGHALQYCMSAHLGLEELRWPSMEAAEVHSFGMEYLSFPWMELFFAEEAERYRRLHLRNMMANLPAICAIDHFQHEVYAAPFCGSEKRHQMWKEIERIYHPHRNYGDLTYWNAGAFWQRILHTYELPFYYVDYALAQVCAMQMYAKAMKDHKAAWTDYLKLCKIGGSCAFTEFLQEGGLVSPFKKGMLETTLVSCGL
jgi:M3 family oligoendopeptidase